MNAYTAGGMKQYQQVGVSSSVEEASPHRLTQMLMEAALEKIRLARGFLQRKDVANKARYITWAHSIINGLHASLDMEKGDEIAKNLDALYDYMENRLLEANLNNDPAILAEVETLMREIKAGWDGIGEQMAASKLDASKSPYGEEGRDEERPHISVGA